MSYTSKIPQAINDIERLTEKALQDIGQLIKDSAKLLSAVDTGRYRSDWDYTALERSVLIGNNVEYAEFLEFGTRKMKAQPALRLAFENNINKIRKICEGYYNELNR